MATCREVAEEFLQQVRKDPNAPNAGHFARAAAELLAEAEHEEGEAKRHQELYEGIRPAVLEAIKHMNGALQASAALRETLTH